MTICKIWDADYPWDVRVEKIASSLGAAGHSVHLVCRNQSRRVRQEQNGALSIHRLPSLSRAFGPLHRVANFPHPLSPVWLRAIGRVVRTSGAHLILVRDMPLVLPAVAVGKLYRIPVILDMAENYPAMLRDRLCYTPTGSLARLIRHPRLARIMERVALRLVDHIIVVVEESRDRLVKDGVACERLSMVSNTPRLDQWDPDTSCNPTSESKGLSVVYLGNLDGSRGVDLAILAISQLKASRHLVRLHVIGDGPSIQRLRKLSSELDVSDRVTITGRLPFRQVQLLLARADVGLIPHYSTEAWNTTIPNKLFDYMLLGLPVIVSDARPTARVVQDTECGEVFHDRDPSDLARCIVALADPEQRKLKGGKGRAAIHAHYNWERDSRVLVEIVEAVGKRSSASGKA